MNQLKYLLGHAELKVLDFNIHTRTEMKTFGRSLPCTMMSYHKKGEARLSVNGSTYNIVPGTVVYIPPNVRHDHYKTSHEETVFLWWHFNYEIANIVDVLKLFQIPHTFKLRDSDRFENVFRQFRDLTDHSGILPSTILKQAKAMELLYLLLDNAVSGDEVFADPPAVNFLGILAKIVQHPERPISLQQLADELHMHPTYICNRFKELFGKSPIQAQKELKIQKAQTLLQTTELSVTEISQMLGFSEIQNFSRLFKTYIHVSPLEYRAVYKKMQRV
ncbi:AraC family transcriptional regulator [Paenibacillus sepulcri]|uniref:AraC family transcriptional regulator n=1 Tax=Paenibacillus sepulcri TaxID=359917 RepID=A0ABS7C0C9_9BACL|nr:AraC family transcriptional regulator [Paenibacillus sepulcri]